MPTLDVEIECVCCKKNIIITVPTVGYRRWLSGWLIQEAMPDLTSDERELLISHVCKRCFAKLEEEDYDEG